MTANFFSFPPTGQNHLCQDRLTTEYNECALIVKKKNANSEKNGMMFELRHGLHSFIF